MWRQRLALRCGAAGRSSPIRLHAGSRQVVDRPAVGAALCVGDYPPGCASGSIGDGAATDSSAASPSETPGAATGIRAGEPCARGRRMRRAVGSAGTVVRPSRHMTGLTAPPDSRNSAVEVERHGARDATGAVLTLRGTPLARLRAGQYRGRRPVPRVCPVRARPWTGRVRPDDDAPVAGRRMTRRWDRPALQAGVSVAPAVSLPQ